MAALVAADQLRRKTGCGNAFKCLSTGHDLWASLGDGKNRNTIAWEWKGKPYHFARSVGRVPGRGGGAQVRAGLVLCEDGPAPVGDPAWGDAVGLAKKELQLVRTARRYKRNLRKVWLGVRFFHSQPRCLYTSKSSSSWQGVKKATLHERSPV